MTKWTKQLETCLNDWFPDQPSYLAGPRRIEEHQFIPEDDRRCMAILPEVPINKPAITVHEQEHVRYDLTVEHGVYPMTLTIHDGPTLILSKAHASAMTAPSTWGHPGPVEFMLNVHFFVRTHKPGQSLIYNVEGFPDEAWVINRDYLFEMAHKAFQNSAGIPLQ